MFFLLFGVFNHSWAQVPVLVKDINPGSSSSIQSGNPVVLNGVYYFAADDGTNGEELWKSDGTLAGTEMVKDINPSGDASIDYLTVFNGVLYFAAENDVDGIELWTSDGTNAGTQMLIEINPGSGDSRPSEFFEINGTLYFRADNGTNGRELWKSDGTVGGTVMVEDIRPGSSGSSPGMFIDVNGTLFFVASNGTVGSELWTSDGTAAGTNLVKDINPGSISATIQNMIASNGFAYFRATDGTNGFELWKSDGTLMGTEMVKDIRSGSGSSSPQALVEFNGEVYFNANEGTSGQELWKSDGTANGTVRVIDINPGPNESAPFGMTDINGTLYFSANDGVHGKELWKSDGTELGTEMVKNIRPGNNGIFPAASNPSGFTFVSGNSTLYFTAEDGSNGRELWKTDGTEAGTVLAADVDPGSGSSRPEKIREINGTLLFAADDGTNGEELWSYVAVPPPLEFVVGDLTAGPNNSVSVPITVNNFTDISSFQGSFEFDPAILTFVSATGPTNPTNSNFATPYLAFGSPGAGGGSVPSNAITFSWIESTGSTHTEADGTVVMELNFTVNGSVSTGSSSIQLGNNPTPLAYFDGSGATSPTAPSTTDGVITLDADPPTVDVASIQSNNANDITLATVGNVITLSFTSSEALPSDPVVTIDKGGAGTITVTDQGGATSWTATKTVAAGDDGVVTFSITVKDQYDNESTRTVTTDGTSVTVDTEVPVITCPPAIAQNNDLGICGAVVNFADATFTDNLAGGSVAQIAGDPSGSTFPVGTSTITYRATDAAGNISDCSFDIVITDNEDPVVVTQGFSVTLDINGDASITVDDIDNGSTDNCAIDTRVLDQSTFDCTDAANSPVTVTLTVTDIYGNSASQTAQVTVNIVANIGIQGEAKSELGTLIPDVTFDINGDDGPATQIGSAFNFLVEPCGTTNDIGAERIDASLNGINVSDAFRIVQHVLFVNRFASNYKQIAADVNATNTINVLDAVEVLRRVLGSKTAFTNRSTGLIDANWIFIDSDETFPSGPYTFSSRRSYVSPSPITGQDFIGVKIGDVNNSWDNAPNRLAAPNRYVNFEMVAQKAQKGSLIRVPVMVSDFTDMSGFQYTMEWDASVLDLKAVDAKALDGFYNLDSADEGVLTAAWIDMNGQSISLADRSVAFELVFEVVGNEGSETTIEINSTATPVHAMDLEGERVGIRSEATKVSVSAITTGVMGPELEGYALVQNRPNPFGESTTLNFSLGQPEKVQIQIYNMTGQVVRSFKGTYGAGSHEINWNGEGEAGMKLGAGVYMVHMRAGEYSATIRVRKNN